VNRVHFFVYGLIYHIDKNFTDSSRRRDSGEGEKMIQYAELSIGRELGRGGFVVVYLGTWRMTDIAVEEHLLGQLTHDVRKEFEAEVQTMKELRHPNIIQFLSYCISPRPCIVMEYMPRGSLHQLMSDRQAEILWDVRMPIGMDITRGQADLHAENIVHLGYECAVD